jgi:hypothetical protein
MIPVWLASVQAADENFDVRVYVPAILFSGFDNAAMLR